MMDMEDMRARGHAPPLYMCEESGCPLMMEDVVALADHMVEAHKRQPSVGLWRVMEKDPRTIELATFKLVRGVKPPQPQVAAPIPGVLVAVAPDGTIYISTVTRLYMSTDGGQSFQGAGGWRE